MLSPVTIPTLLHLNRPSIIPRQKRLPPPMWFPILPSTLISPILPRDLNTSIPLPFSLLPFSPVRNRLVQGKTSRDWSTTKHLHAKTVCPTIDEVAVVMAPFE